VLSCKEFQYHGIIKIKYHGQEETIETLIFVRL
jgi:hypothetical protein